MSQYGVLTFGDSCVRILSSFFLRTKYWARLLLQSNGFSNLSEFDMELCSSLCVFFSSPPVITDLGGATADVVSDFNRSSSSIFEANLLYICSSSALRDIISESFFDEFS